MRLLTIEEKMEIGDRIAGIFNLQELMKGTGNYLIRSEKLPGYPQCVTGMGVYEAFKKAADELRGGENLMPCDTIQTVTVQTELKGLNKDLLKKALESMGFTAAISNAGTTLTFSGYNKETGTYHSGSYSGDKFKVIEQGYGQKLDINSVKQAYSHQVVQKSAMSFGWKLTKQSNNKYIATKGI